MQASPAIAALVQQALQDVSAKNPETAITSASHEPGFLYIGLTPEESFESVAGYEAMVRAVAEGNSGRGDLPADFQIQAFEEGTVGWAGYRYTATLPDGNVLTFRGTAVFHQENGAWKMVQYHYSTAVPEELMLSIARPAG